jgi:hypothetical protein
LVADAPLLALVGRGRAAPVAVVADAPLRSLLVADAPLRALRLAPAERDRPIILREIAPGACGRYMVGSYLRVDPTAAGGNAHLLAASA